MASAVDSRLAYARLSAVATASRLPTATRGSNNSYTTSWDTTRIPAPLVVKRYAGRTPIQELAAEILGLSKMNWNTFDLYTKLPATLQSSGEIAKIGSLLQRFGGSCPAEWCKSVALYAAPGG